MSSARRRRAKVKAVNTAFYLGRKLNKWIDDGLYEDELASFYRYDRKLYRIRKRIIHNKG